MPSRRRGAGGAASGRPRRPSRPGNGGRRSAATARQSGVDRPFATAIVRHLEFRWCRMAGTAVFLWNFNMFAVIKTGGKQYKVAAGDVLEVELLAGEAGDKIEFDQVLAVGAGKDLKVGQAVGAAKVKAEVIGRTRGPKLIVFKKRRRQNSRRKNGHRQSYTAVKILEIAA